MPTSQQLDRIVVQVGSTVSSVSGSIALLQNSLTSGAINSGVPQNVLVVFPNHISSLHKP